MRILCAISGLDFQADHFPGFLAQREAVHPIFHMPQKKLLSYTGKFYSSELTDIDKYLLFLAVLNSSELVDFRASVQRTAFTPGIIARNFDPLVHIICKLNSILSPAVVFPRFVISQETRTLSNVHFWLDNWLSAYKEFLAGDRKHTEGRKLIARELALERLIKNPHRAISDYANQIADWAVVAGDLENRFRGKIPDPFTLKSNSIAEYWRSIIIRCARQDKIYAIPEADLDEIIEFYESELDVVGSIYSFELLKLLRIAKKKRGDYLGLSDISSPAISYQILSESDDVMASNLKLMIDLAPTEEPIKNNYPDTISYLRARSRWVMAKNSGKFDLLL